jgi:hypothetical protein
VRTKTQFFTRDQIDNQIPLLVVILTLAAASNAQSVCPKACTYIYLPVCGFNGQEHIKFGNQCQMESMNECEVQEGDRKFEKVFMNDCDEDK